jgi:serine/threonine-protein kinase
MPPPTFIDKYQIIKPLGSGNFGQVYHVFDRALRADKAIKVLENADPAAFMKNLEEAQILNRCRHKHIVTINEANIFVVNGQRRVVLDLEYIPEGSLEAALSSRWVSIKETVAYVRGVLLGLEHAHTQGLLHRDVKPGNILLAKANPKLSDFGLATASGAALIGSAKGYRPHLPPEYYAHPATTAQTDIYAVGITLFRSLSNISDWRAVIQAIPNVTKHLQEGTLITKIGYEEFIPQSLRRIVRKACHPDPAKRFATATELRQRLDSLRFDVDWIRVADNEWQGYCEKKTHRCVADMNSCKLITTVNNRRVSSLCQSFATPSEVMAYMHHHVADTTMK